MSVEMPGMQEPMREQPVSSRYEARFRDALAAARAEIASLPERELGAQLRADREAYLSSIGAMERTADQLVEERVREADTRRQLHGSEESPTKLLPIRERIRRFESQLTEQDRIRSSAHTKLAVEYITAGLLPNATQLTLADFRYIAEARGRYTQEAALLEGADNDRLLPALARLRNTSPDELLTELDDLAVDNARLTVNDQGHDRRNDMTRVTCAVTLLQRGVDMRADLFPQENKPHEEAWELPDRK